MIGVGFISGAEIYEFFVRFGNFCYVGIGLFFVLNFLFCFKILMGDNHQNNITKLYLFKNKRANNTFLNKNKIKKTIIFFNVLLIASAMFSGLRVLSKSLFNDNYFIAMILCVLFVFLVLYFGINGLSKVDSFVFVFVVVLVILFGAKAFGGQANFESVKTTNWAFGGSAGMLLGSLLFSSLYVFMNIVQIEPLYEESGIIFSKKTAAIVSFLFSAFLTIVLVVFVEFMIVNMSISSSSMPFLAYFAGKGGAMHIVFVLGLFFAILTTLLSCLLGVKRPIINFLNNKFAAFSIKERKSKTISKSQNLGKLHKKNKKLNFDFKNFLATTICVFIAFAIGFVDFHVFVSIIYPAIGVLNFVIFVFL